MEKIIRNKLEPVKFLQEGSANGVNYEIICFLYKGKEPVYYSFVKGTQNRPIVNGLSFTSVHTLTEWLLNNKDPNAYKIIDSPFIRSRKLTFMEMKLLNITR